MEKYTLITGGASGLGLELSKLFAQDGTNLFLVSSNIKNLESAKELIEKDSGVKVHILAVDLTNPGNFLQVKEYSDKNDLFINNLVNCAGFGDRTDFKDMDIDRQIKMVELNCNAPLYLMRVYLDNMLKYEEGHILNISSIAAFYPGPYMCTYHATKAFLLNISEAIERELKGTKIKLTTVCPGPFESGFVEKAKNNYTFKKIKPISTKKAADITYTAFKKNKSLKVIGFGNQLTAFVSRFFPRKFITNVSVTNIKKEA